MLHVQHPQITLDNTGSSLWAATNNTNNTNNADITDNTDNTLLAWY
jgi:hypothetical protein